MSVSLESRLEEHEEVQLFLGGGANMATPLCKRPSIANANNYLKILLSS